MTPKENILQCLFNRYSMTKPSQQENKKTKTKTKKQQQQNRNKTKQKQQNKKQGHFERRYATSSLISTCFDVRLLIFASLAKNRFAFDVCGIAPTTGDKTENYNILQYIRSVGPGVFTSRVLTQSR